MAELIGRKPLFPGDDYLNQIQLIVDALGQPSEEDLNSLKDDPNKSAEDVPAIRYLKDLNLKEKKPWKQVPQLSQATDKSLELLDALLTFNAQKRLTAKQALMHPYLAVYHGQRLEASDRVFSETDDIDEAVEATKAGMREAIHKEIELYRQYSS